MTEAPRFRLDPADIVHVGVGLARPECVLAQADGTLWTSDSRGGVMRISPDGGQRLIGAIPGLPNGIAMEASGSLLVAEIDHGVLHRLHADGTFETVLDNLEGAPLGAVNFVLTDRPGRIWVTVSTRLSPRKAAATTPTHDGYIVLIDAGGPRIAADGLCFPNEARFDATGRFLFVSETSLRRISRFAVDGAGRLGGKVIYGPEVLPGRPDGIVFDMEGNLWFTDVDRNGLGIIRPDGRLEYAFEDPQGRVLDFPSSLAFGGPDGRTAYVGSVRMEKLPSFRAPHAGLSVRLT